MPNPLIMPQAISSPSQPEVRAIANGGLGPPPGGPPQGAPGQPGAMPTPPPEPPTPEQLENAHKHLGVIVDEITQLVGKPSVNRKDVMDAAGRMIKGGAFSEADGKKALVAQLAGLPDNEQQLRQFLGHYLLRASQSQQMVAQLMQGGAPPQAAAAASQIVGEV